jgi:hypothetical protein
MWLTRRRVTLALLVVVAGLLTLTAVRLVQAARAASDGKQALLSAAQAVNAHDPKAAETRLTRARADFARARSALAGTGPVLPLARVTPFVRVQVRAMDSMARVGQDVADAGLTLMPTARALLTPGGGSNAQAKVAELETSKPQVDAALLALGRSSREVHALDGYRLLGPLDSAHRQLETRLDDAVHLASQGQQALTVLLDLSGASSQHSYLLLSQNPDEPRPTGGYMGTYGVLVGSKGKVQIPRYGSMGQWNVDHPQAAIPVAQAPFPFRYATPPHPQSLGNANTTPDWPASAALAARIWQRGREKPVDGVLTFTPALLTRLLAVVGPTKVPGYPDTVTAATVDSRVEYYVHGEASVGKGATARKEFLSELAHAVLDRTLHAPPSKLTDLGKALSVSLSRREASVWSNNPDVQAAIAGLGWDGALPNEPGDFYADAEFAFASKNGRHLLRTFDHQVVLSKDGSGSSSTAMVERDTEPYDQKYNQEAHAYITPYGPQGGVLLATADPSDAGQASLAGHPSAGWLRDAPPLGEFTLKVGWQAPNLLLRRSDGLWLYRLTWLPQPGHSGDVLNLHVTLPAGWKWRGAAPPRSVNLSGPYTGEWLVQPAGS